MKLHILSDLHLSVHPLAPPCTDADVVVLAGDIARPLDAITWAQGFAKPVLLVPGNHEFYGSSLQETVQALQDHARGTQIHVLDNNALVIGEVRFLGTTLWTDFLAAGAATTQQEAMRQAQQFNRDFSRIRVDPDIQGRLFTPQDCAALFARNARWLQAQLALPFAGPTVVITHHAPSLRSVPERFAGSLLNANFVSDAEHLLADSQISLWVHGHLHDSFDYALHGTRVLCNPRGYARDGINENSNFDPQLTVLLASPASS